MRIKSAHIENFKGIKDLHIDLEDYSGQGRDLTCLIGDNGSGKTSVLQAIALTLSLATMRILKTSQFHWNGFLPERMSSLGPTRIELTIDFSKSEIEETRGLHKKWFDSLPAIEQNDNSSVEPSDLEEVTLTYQQNQLTSSNGKAGLLQFYGKHFLRSLIQTAPELRAVLKHLGDIYWFDQYRNLGSVRIESKDNQESADTLTWNAGVENLREQLLVWSTHKLTTQIATQMKGGPRIFIDELAQSFERVFPGRKVFGSVAKHLNSPRSIEDFYFLFEYEGRRYDLAEMSSGEQAIFPILCEFVRLDIGNSIVLIDELELHLHAAEQQRLLNALPSLGTNNQFIITTHSQHVADAIPNDHEVRLEGGVLCL